MAKSSRLTVGLIEGTRAESKDIWLSDDDGSRGGGRLALRLSPSGSRLFYFRYFAGKKKTVLPLGAYAKAKTPNCFTLEEAREIAARYSFMMRTSAVPDLRTILAPKVTLTQSANEPAEAPRTAATDTKPQDPAKKTVLDLCNAYVKHLDGRGAQSARTVAYIVKNHVQATPWADITAADLTTEQATDMVRRVVEAGHTTTASHLRQLLQAAYNMAKKGSRNPLAPAIFKEFCIVINPVSDVASLNVAITARERPALNKLELGHMWRELIDPRHNLSVVVRAIELNR